MNFSNNIPISVKKKAFSDVAPKMKKIEKVVVGVGNGYSSDDRDMRYVKLFFDNNPNQTTKNLSYTKPISSNDITEVLSNIQAIIRGESFAISKNIVCEAEGISLKDRKQLQSFISELK